MKLYSICFLLLFLSHSICAQTVQIATDKGLVAGYEKDDIQIFKGIPFAAPPVGELRWRAPQEHKSWSGVLDCQIFSASPMQSDPEPFRMWSEEFIAPPEPLSEDCLYLNIWSKSSNEKKPVFVWMYGGGFNSGSAACVIYDGMSYAKEDVVFVSINYRVNIFGYLSHPELSAESENGISGNYGLLDQIQSLKWIQDNIEAFGGDPNNVTIAGQSAGAMSIHCLVASPLAKGLFHQAIAQSGGLLGGSRARLLHDAETDGAEFIAKMNGKSIENMRQIPADELFKLVQKSGGMRYGPVRDNYVLPNDLMDHYKKGNHNDVPFMAGWVTGDGQLFSAPDITSATYALNANNNYGKDAEGYLELFPGNSPEELQASISKRNLMNFAVMPSYLWADFNKKDAFIYEYSHVPVEKKDFPDYGAFHTSEVPFALGNLFTWDREWRGVDYEVESFVSTYWLNFIKTGNPNGGELPKWPVYKGKKDGVIQALNQNPAGVEKMYADELQFLEKQLAK